MNKLTEWYLKELGEGWYNVLRPFLVSEDMETIRKTVLERRKSSVVMPKSTEMFEAFKLCKWEDVRVVIVGIEPYHIAGHATGLAFKSKKLYPLHPVVKEIFEEVERDVYFKEQDLHLGQINDVSLWASQGVLLLNRALTVQKDKQHSHIKLWEPFTSNIFKVLREKTGLIYLLWGNFAQSCKPLIDSKSNYILEAGFPATGAFTRGFKNCNHFSQVNDIITKQNGEEFKINW